MHLKKTTVSLTLLVMLAPFAASAQSSDDIILNLLNSLDGPVVSTPVASTTPVLIASKPKPKPVSTEPEQQILAPLYVFNIDGNTAQPDPQIESMKSVLAGLMAQFAALVSNGGAAVNISTSTVASSTLPSETPAKVVFTRDLGQGSKGDDVSELQRILIARGFLFGDVTGFFGVLTKTAVLAFQTDGGLPSVGTVGPRTRALLNAIATSDVGTPEIHHPTVPASIPYIASSTSVSFANVSSTSTATSTASTSTPPVPGAWGKPVAISISILPTEAPVGGTVAVTWLSQNADTCEASDGWGGPKPTIGAAQIGPLSFSLNLVLTCTGAGGVASTSALVVVGGEQ